MENTAYAQLLSQDQEQPLPKKPLQRAASSGNFGISSKHLLQHDLPVSLLEVKSKKEMQHGTITRSLRTVHSGGFVAVGKPLDFNVPVAHDHSGQHTVRWTHKLGLPSGKSTSHVEPGTCNLYHYPTVTFADEGLEQELDGDCLEVLMHLILSLTALPPSSDATADSMRVPDESGAFLVHGLLIANTDASVGLALKILGQRPDFIPQAHAEGPFFGENVLHVLAVNQRESEAISLLDLAVSHLDEENITSLLLSFATVTAAFPSGLRLSHGCEPLFRSCLPR